MRRRARGITLAELLVAALLLAVILAISYLYLAFGLDNSQWTRTTVEVQQSANLAAYRLSRELMETDPFCVEFSSPGTAGVIFPSARDAAGKFHCQPQTGRPVWQKLVAYYLAPDPEYPDPRVDALYRVEVFPPGLPSSQAEPASSFGVTLASVIGSPKARLVAHGLVAPTASDPYGGFDVYSLAPDGSPTHAQSNGVVLIDLEAVNRKAAVAIWSRGRDNANSVVSHLEIDIRG